MLAKVVLILLVAILGVVARERWSVERSLAWERKQGYRAGFNFAPSTAVNELEMFQVETYDPETIDRELGWAQNAGFNAARVFLHNILFEQDAEAFYSRLDNFLAIADNRGIKVILVLLDSCWNAHPKAGTQPEPIPGVHNSQWVQAPGVDVVTNPTEFQRRVQPYVQSVVGKFKHDDRIMAWDLWNEPNNSGYGDDVIAPLLQQTFEWAQAVDPSQPLTTPIWQSTDSKTYTSLQKLQLDVSDVLSFHNYDSADKLSTTIDNLRNYDAQRPIICTEYMARTAGSTFEPHLGIMRERNVHAINWGFVSGRIQTIYPWANDAAHPATQEPTVWFHDVLRADGTPFNATEIAYIQSVLLPKKV